MEFKKDKYSKNRGNYSRLLKLSCRVCDNNVLTYQKDGPGNLRRLYFDRIVYPENLTFLENKTLSKVKNLDCPKCKEMLGTPYIYKKENRRAFKLYQDAITKKIVKRINDAGLY